MRYPPAAAVFALLLAASPSHGADVEPTIGLYVSAATDWAAETVDALTLALEDSGYVVRLNEKADVAFDPHRLSLIVVADARRVPGKLPEALAQYVQKGGNLALLGGPFFDELLTTYGDRVLDHQQLVEEVGREVQPTVLLDFEAAEVPPWQNHSDKRSEESTAQRVKGGAAGTEGALELRASAEAGWDTFQSPALGATPDAHNLLATFWAKGDGPKSQLVVEWRERDGSRWMTTVQLSEQWQRYVLPVEAFCYWHDSRVHGRGGKGDVLHPEKVATITLGLAQSHALFTGIKGHRTIWVDEIGFARPPKDLQRPADLLPNRINLPVIETASPRYKLFPVTNAKTLQVNPAQRIAAHIKLPPASEVYAPIAKPDGTGLDRNRPGRFISLIRSLDEHGRPQTSPASLFIPARMDQGMVFSMPIGDDAFFADPAVIKWVGGVVERMIDGVFLLEAGTKYYASFGEEKMPFGAVVVNRGRDSKGLGVEFWMADPAGKTYQGTSLSASVRPGEQCRVADLWEIPQGKGNRFHVIARMHHENSEIDQIEHALRIWEPTASPEFLTARDGDFYLEGRRWFAHGVNYMPSSGVACEDHATFEYWLDGRAYGQEIIRRDLANLKDIGLNSVSAFVYYRSHADRNLLDFLMQCGDQGFKVNLSLRPGTPLNFRSEEICEMITANRLAENDTIIAYDLAWEPMWGTRAQRKQHDGAWRAWINLAHGDLAKAEAAWGFAAPRKDGEVVGPDDVQIVNDGPWRKMVIDYRRFLNDTLRMAYRRARDVVHEVDKNHLVSFRMTIAGDPTSNPGRMAYDPLGLTGAVDIMEPEGYGRIGDWQKVRPGRFTVAYCRAVAPEVPVMWAEFGYSVWDPNTGAPSQDRLDFAERFYDDFLRMAWESDSNGTFSWYSCGGYRINERSDYGILGPDGAWRAHTEVLHRWAEPMTGPRARKPVDRWIPIELEQDVDGVAGIYRRVSEAFWNAIEEGQNPGLRVRGGMSQFLRNAAE